MDRRSIRDTAGMMLLAFGLLLTISAPALAHADLVSSTPADGAVLEEPVDRFELIFTAAVQPLPGGIRLVDGSRTLPVTVLQPSDEMVVIEPPEPLGEGGYGLLWKVEAADAHIIEGTISIDVVLPGSTSEDETASVDEEASAEGGVSATAPTTTTPNVTTTSLPMVSDRIPEHALRPQAAVAGAPDSEAGDWIARIGRWAMMVGALLAIGAFVFAGTALTGSEGEVRGAVRWVRRGGVLVLLGTIVEVVGLSTERAGSLIDGLSRATLVDVLAGSFGVAVLLRLAGGIALLQDPRLATTHLVPPIPNDPGTGVIATGDQPAGGVIVTTEPPPQRFRLEMGQEWVAAAGVLAVAASFLFDGHTAPVEHSVIARGASFMHVIAAAVWFGGLVVMAATLTKRRRSNEPLDAAAMAIRFSRSATAALVVLTAAGLALSWTIIESPADLFSGNWGRLLIVKVALVGVAALMGAYNHFTVLPQLDRSPTEANRLRRVIRIEAVLLIGVVAITAILVGAAP